MIVVSNTQQSILLKEDKERFMLNPRAIAKNAPDWIMQNKQALELREKELIHFEIQKQPKTQKEKLLARAEELGLITGDDITIGNLEQKILNKEKELDDKK